MERKVDDSTYLFEMWDWESKEFYVIPRINIIEALYYAWNCDNDAFKRTTGQPVLLCDKDNEDNSTLLKDYKLRMIDKGDIRVLQNTLTDQVYGWR